MNTPQTPGPAGVQREALAGPGIHPPGPPSAAPGDREIAPLAAGAASARPSESRVGVRTRPAGDNFPVVPGNEPTPGSAAARGGAARESTELGIASLGAGADSDPRADGRGALEARKPLQRAGVGPFDLSAAQVACPHLTTNTTGTKCADCGLRFPRSSFALPERCDCPMCRRWKGAES